MSSTYLSKSAFAHAVSCPTKLFYLNAGYPSTADDDEYLELLAEGGFIIGALARLRYPGGVLLPRTADRQADFEHTKKILLGGDCVLFEGTFVDKQKLAIADIIERRGSTLRLIEVKSKSFERNKSDDEGSLFRNKRGEIRSEWTEYLYDVTFQVAVLANCFPHFKVEPSLLLVDKGKRISVEGIQNYISLARGANGAGYEVQIAADLTELTKATALLTELDVAAEVQQLLPEVIVAMNLLEESIITGKKIVSTPSRICQKCEYRGDALEPSGFQECWKEIPSSEPHLFDLFFGSTIKVEGEFLFNELLSKKKASLFDVPLEALKGKRGERQLVQIESTRTNTEWFDPRLASFLGGIKYPLHFIDFETTRTALPFHKGMRPFEQIAFQWSCHTVADRTAAPVHSEWINVEPEFPNFKFAASLMETVSTEGTILTWATHEGSVLTDILEQMEVYEHQNKKLLDFLTLLVSSKGSQGRLVDMNRLTLDFYFHPDMKGKTSIKKVFPAIWKSNDRVRKLPWFLPYSESVDGEIVDPYKNLPALDIGGIEVSVHEGTAAMRAYEEMIFGQAAKKAEQREQWKKLLLQYCKLDTLAMVAIWEHWEQLSGR